MSTVMDNGFGFSRFMIQNFSQVAQQSAVKTAELSPEAMSRRSTADDDDEEDLGTQVEDEHHHHQQPRATQLSYERVAHIAFQAASRIDWRQLRNSTSLWDEKKRLSASSNFAIYTRQSRGMHYVMAVGSVSCSVSELRSILRPTTDAKFTAAMTELYGDAFMQGSIMHHSRSSSVSSNSKFPTGSRSSTMTNTGGTRSSHRSVNNNNNNSGSANTNSGFMAKTATFAKAHVFAKSQQWSFLECYQETPGQRGFTVTMSSLSPFFEIPGRPRASTKTSGGLLSPAIEQLQGTTAAYSVFADPDQPNGELQVTFYSKFAEDCTSFSPLKRHAFKLTLKSHLMTMARATTRLPIIVRRKRLEVLAPTDTKAFTLSNPLCICCTATLHLFRAKTRCHSCGYFVCDKCSIEQEVEVENPQAPIVLTRVCQPCIRRVDKVIYERVSVAADGDDENVDHLRASSAQVACMKTSSMADLLDHIFHTGPEGKKQAVMSVIKYVLDDDDDDKSKKNNRNNNRKKRTSSLSSHSPRVSRASSFDNDSFAHTDPKSEKDYLRALQTHLTVNHLTTNHDRQDTKGFCIYVPTEDEGDFTDTGGSNKSSNTSALSQTKQYKSHHDYRHAVTSSSPSPCCSQLTPQRYPVPSDEAHRSKMARRHHQRLASTAAEDVSSLEIICSIACKELACAVAMVTVVESDLTHVVATNSEVYRNAVVPRAESFCAYTIMSDEPLVVARPERDTRFRDFEIVQQGLSFYCGFPLTSQDGSVIGTLCCGDFASKDEVSRAQLDAMAKLAATASKVMQLRSKDVYKRFSEPRSPNRRPFATPEAPFPVLHRTAQPLLEDRKRLATAPMARVQSAHVFDEPPWSMDAKDSEISSATTPAILQPHSPQPLLEEQRRQTSNRKSRARSRANTATAQTHHEHSQSHHSPNLHPHSNPTSGVRLQISDRRLAEAAHRAASAIDWDNLRAGRSSVWDKEKTLGDFGIYTRRSGRVHHIMASGSVACSIAEMQHILCTTTSERYVAAMEELHGASFLSGAVVHRINTRVALASTSSSELANNNNSTSSNSSKGCYDLTVKTATFAKAHVFARDEHWCYLDLFQPQADKKKFLLTMHSLYPEDVLLPATTSTMSHSRHGSQGTSQQQQTPLPVSSNQLQEMSVGYSVVADPRRSLVWIVFYAQFADPSTTDNSSSRASSGSFFKGFYNKPHASKSTTKKRLMKMAKATCCLPMIVRRRRLGVQVFIDPKAFTPPNTHCICCTVALSLLTKKSQVCHLCGYCVCDKCSSKQHVERAHTSVAQMQQLPTVRVCLTCSRRVDAANYDKIPTGAISPSAIKSDAPDAVPANKLLADLLRDSFENAVDDDKKRAVIQVIKNLLEQQQEPLRSSSTSTQSSSGLFQTKISQDATTLFTDDDFVDALDTKLHVKEFALDECVLGNAQCREYPISYKDEQDVSVPNFPVPVNEELRLNFVRQRRLSDIKNVPELEIICSIARKELGCSAGLVTVVDQDEVHVIASSDASFQNLVVPREESICSHTIMSDKPLLLPHADSDVRFSRMAGVDQGGLSYYCGFPLITSDNAVIGSVCCIDSQDHDVTQAQYAMMIKLASTASRVMEMRAKADAA